MAPETLTRAQPSAIQGAGARPGFRLAVFGLLLVAATAVLALVHITQGTSTVNAADIIGLILGNDDADTAAVVAASRVPRLVAGVLVGVALGVAGVIMQSVSRNALASPDTLAVNAGAHLAIVAVAAFGIQVPLLGAVGVAFLGGIAAASLVLALSGAGQSGSVRLVLAGSAIALAFSALTHALLLLFAQETRNLFAWGSGSLAQSGMEKFVLLAPLIGVVVAVLLIKSRSLDLLTLGDDQARVLGINVRSTQVLAIVLAVLLAAAAVTISGPIGFVGLAAPAVVRLAAAKIPGLHRHVALILASALMGIFLVLGADVLLRAIIGAQTAVEVPTGVVTTIFGAIFLVILAHRMRTSGPTREARSVSLRPTRPGAGAAVVVLLVLLVLAGIAAGLLLGDAKLLLGDLANWVTGQAGPVVSSVMDARFPRVAASLLAGASLALAGTVIQAVTRNPLAEPSIIGVSGGAGLGAILVITLVPLAGFWTVSAGAGIGAAVTAAVVFGLAFRGGLQTDRFVLVGIGVSAAAMAGITLLIVMTDPFNEAKALTWLSGSTYGRSMENLIPMSIALLITVPVIASLHRTQDLLSLDEDTPKLLGISVPRSRMILLVSAVVLTGSAVAGIGVIGFVGLVAPHAARALVGARHKLAIPTAVLLGALLVCVGDMIGRTAIAPQQLPAGLLTALLGAPYFVWLLFRSRLAR
ncbi:iron complex transport system permease protein [Arthrobacter pigmenti]|uniref:Iron complex transport system permease protein n=1 Tax=Arthrobacter pigmenti TaxID=271432 RepID=A0A846RDE6_9MICC|nr:iron ABC transporter permease [Arthrobacter pigmenti]NJC21138.1 iron complex transport system permease protein [Arthrobacter pigmenti]